MWCLIAANNPIDKRTIVNILTLNDVSRSTHVIRNITTMETSNQDLAAFKEAIDAQHARIADAFEKADSAIIGTDVFTDDAWLVGDGDDNTTFGGKAAGDVFAAFVGKYRWQSTSVRYGVSGSVGYDYANAVMRPVEEGDVLTFKLLFIWEKINDKWMASGQMYVTGNYPV